MKRTSADVQDDGQEGHQGTLPQAKVARVDNEEAADEGSSAGSLLESVGDDVLMLIMDWCGLEASVRAFFLSNHHLRGLLCRHQGLWRRAYEELFKLPESKDKKSSLRRAPKKEPLPPPPVDDYFVAYTEAMRKWTGAFDFEEDDVPLAEDDGEVVVKVDFFGRATWEGYGIGCGRAGEYTSLHCLAGRGKLELAYKKGQLTAKVVGWERSENDDCERGYDDDDEDEDEDEEVDAKEKEKRQKEKEELKKKKEEAENYPAQWVKTTLAQLRASSTFYYSVTYRLHLDSPRKGYRGKCTGGSVCRSWHEDMEW